MKHLRNFALLILAVALLLICCGCENPFSKPAGPEDYKNIPEGSVLFFRDYQEKIVTEKELLDYTSEYTQYNSTYFKSLLEDEDLCIYNAYIYAMEHGYTNFELYVADNEKDFSFIRHYVGLDSPFLEQNVSVDSESTLLWSSNAVGERVRFTIDHFTDANWQKKLEALDACKKIIAEMPDFDTQEEQLEYLLQQVCKNTTYTDYGSQTTQSYLYDAVINGQSNCDGYSNMLFLLFRLAGVDACEAMGNDAAGENDNAVGHTWVVAKVNDNFYNYDATYADDEEMISMVYASFSDELVDVKHIDYDKVRPKCTDNSLDFDFAHCIVDNDSKENAKKFAKVADHEVNSGNYEITLVIKKVLDEDDFDDFLDNLMNATEEIAEISTTYIMYDSFSILNVSATPR